MPSDRRRFWRSWFGFWIRPDPIENARLLVQPALLMGEYFVLRISYVDFAIENTQYAPGYIA